MARAFDAHGFEVKGRFLGFRRARSGLVEKDVAFVGPFRARARSHGEDGPGVARHRDAARFERFEQRLRRVEREDGGAFFSIRIPLGAERRALALDSNSASGIKAREVNGRFKASANKKTVLLSFLERLEIAFWDWGARYASRGQSFKEEARRTGEAPVQTNVRSHLTGKSAASENEKLNPRNTRNTRKTKSSVTDSHAGIRPKARFVPGRLQVIESLPCAGRRLSRNRPPNNPARRE